MDNNWIVENLTNAFGVWNSKMTEMWSLLTESPQTFKGGTIWQTIVTINGGIEEGGIDLCKEEDHYRTLTWDDFPAYYEVGVVKQLVMADDIELSDGAADFGADPVMVKGDRAVCDAMSSEEDVYGWNAGNTTVTIQNGEMTHVDRIWVP